MPLFSYRCSKCNHDKDELVAKHDTVVPCPQCGADKMDKLFSAPAFKFTNGKGTHMGSLMSIPGKPPGFQEG